MTAACMSGRRRKAAAECCTTSSGELAATSCCRRGRKRPLCGQESRVSRVVALARSPKTATRVRPQRNPAHVAVPRPTRETLPLVSTPAAAPARLVSRASPRGPRWPRAAPLGTWGKAALRNPGHGARPARPCPLRPTTGPALPDAPGDPRAPPAPPRGLIIGSYLTHLSNIGVF